MRSAAARGRPAPLHRLPGVQCLRHAGARGDPRALLVQQSAGRLPRVQRLRRDAGVRRVADRARSGHGASPTAPSIRGPSRATRRAGACCSTPPARWAPTWTAVEARSRRRSGGSCCTGGKGRYVGIFPFLKGPRGEALQAVHPGVPAAVPAGPDLRRLPRHPAQRHALAVRVGGDRIADMSRPARWTACTTGCMRSR